MRARKHARIEKPWTVNCGASVLARLPYTGLFGRMFYVNNGRARAPFSGCGYVNVRAYMRVSVSSVLSVHSLCVCCVCCVLVVVVYHVSCMVYIRDTLSDGETSCRS